MTLPGWDSLEKVEHIHSTLEGWALVFFAILVTCDVLLHFEDGEKRPRLTRWMPFLKKSSLVSFGFAILLEIFAYPYSERNDELSTKVIADLGLKAAQATKDAEAAKRDAGTFTAR